MDVGLASLEMSELSRLMKTVTCVFLLTQSAVLAPSPLVSARWASHSVAADVKPIAQSLELQCPPCEKLHCSPRNAKRLRCKGGITRGVCNCCPVCAKLQGETCGGQYNFLGKCDRGLRCQNEHSTKHKYVQLMASEKAKTWMPEGRCVTVLPHEQMDQPVFSFCKPKCTPEFCTKSPRALCSAVDNAEKTRGCHGDCQHTSCRACHFVEETPGCGKCALDDFDCIKAFGRCMKDQVCTRKKHPCRPNYNNPSAKFKCVVPECLN